MILVFGKDGQLANGLDIFPNTLCVGRSSCGFIFDDCYIDLIMNKQITAVINASGYTDTVSAEQNIDDAMKLNHQIPVNLFYECLKKNIPFIHILTDYVGEKEYVFK